MVQIQKSIVATANYFYTCHSNLLENSNQLTCISYSAYICNESVPVGCQNATIAGCINPLNSAKIYRNLNAPITYISLEDLARLRASGATAIVGIIVLTISIILTFILSFYNDHPILLYVSLVFLIISDIFLVVALVTGSLVIRYYHVGCGLFVTGTMCTFLFTMVGSFVVGRLEAISTTKVRAENYEIKENNTRNVSS